MKHRISAQQNEVLSFLRKYPEGLTCDELSVIMGVTPNQISGRFSELRRDGKIYKVGKRLTRGGNPAAVLRAIEE
jgi:predicted transcriptional regulator